MTQRTTTNPALPQIKPARLRTFHARLAGWYQAHGRHELPWRNTGGDAYPVWISEVMLQQTQVATVLARFYHPFLAKFPTVESLAAAPQEAVLKAWEGLGYYSRARNLHKAAQTMAAHANAARRNRAALPDTAEALLALPGIGRNTAHAVLAFGYHQPVAILEANVKRIIARIFALAAPSDAELWQGAEMLLNPAAPFDYNQAMMDLGATLCTPRNPACDLCPANHICEGKSAPESYPTRKVKKAVPTREVAITALRTTGGKLHLATRSEKLLGGLWGFPQAPYDSVIANDSEAAEQGDGVEIGIATHTYSHFKLIGHVVLRTVSVAEQKAQPHWFSRAEIAELPLSTLDHKVLALVEKHHTNEKKPPKPRSARAGH